MVLATDDALRRRRVEARAEEVRRGGRSDRRGLRRERALVCGPTPATPLYAVAGTRLRSWPARDCVRRCLAQTEERPAVTVARRTGWRWSAHR